MFSQKLRHVEDDELRIDIDPCYEADPYELKLDEMIDAEPEPEVIEGLPASDALTPADRYLELFTNVQKSRIFADSKTFPDCAPKHDPLDILRNYRKVKRQPDFDLRQFDEDNFWLPESQSDIYISDPSLRIISRGHRYWRCRRPTSCPAVALAKPITGTLISPCWGWRRAAGKIC